MVSVAMLINQKNELQESFWIQPYLLRKYLGFQFKFHMLSFNSSNYMVYDINFISLLWCF